MSNNEKEDFYRICPSCSFFCNAVERDKYCSLCGTELISACRNCTKEITNPYAKFCKQCGHLIRDKISKKEEMKY